MFGKEIILTSRLDLRGRIYAFFWGFPMIGPRIRSFHVMRILKTITRPADILDAGCGMGNYCFYLAKKFTKSRITGIDCDEKAILDAGIIKKKLNVDNANFIIQDLSCMNLEKCCDLIMLIDVLEHIEDDEKTLKGLFNALKNSGNILVHVPRQGGKRCPDKDVVSAQPGHVRNGYTEEKLKQMLRTAGFKILHTKNTFGFFGNLAYGLEASVHKKSKLLLKIIFPLLLCLGRMDTLTKNTEGNGLLVWATK